MPSDRTQSLTLVFAHGWAMGDWFWEPLATQFADYEFHFCSRGYFEQGAEPCSSSQGPTFSAGLLPEATSWVGIGHSFGFRRLLEADLINCRGLVSICGFRDFVADEGTDPRIVKAMVRRMPSSPETVLEQFLENCGVAEGVESARAVLGNPTRERGLQGEDLNLNLLEVDLKALLKIGQDVESNVPILSLAASHDKIVPATLTRSEFEQPLFHPSAGHGLGFQHSDWCASHIQEFLNTL